VPLSAIATLCLCASFDILQWIPTLRTELFRRLVFVASNIRPRVVRVAAVAGGVTTVARPVLRAARRAIRAITVRVRVISGVSSSSGRDPFPSTAAGRNLSAA
jgi:hypothetical protein